jgi:hypothetical protein
MVKDKAAAPEAKAAEGGAKEGAKEKKKPAKAADDSLSGKVEAQSKKKEWTMERLAKVARRFDSEDAWKHGAPSSYKAAHAKGLVAQCMGHAKKGARPVRHTA